MTSVVFQLRIDQSRELEGHGTHRMQICKYCVTDMSLWDASKNFALVVWKKTSDFEMPMLSPFTIFLFPDTEFDTILLQSQTVVYNFKIFRELYGSTYIIGTHRITVEGQLEGSFIQKTTYKRDCYSSAI